MLKRVLLLAVMAGVVIYALAQLFLLRFAAGDIYPPYCTLRPDPLGTKAIYEALDELPQIETRRNFRRIGQLRPAGATTLFYAGTPHDAWWERGELRDLQRLVANGMRVVITFLPVSRAPTPYEEERAARKKKVMEEEGKSRPSRRDDASEKDAAGKPASEEEKTEEKDPLALAFSKVAERWGFAFKYLPRAEGKGAASRKAIVTTADPGLEPELAWRSVLYFADLTPEWRTIYTCGGQPSVIERDYGDGSIVLASDSYFLSNEALRAERHPRLLAWLAGAANLIVFDEESHGVKESPGIATLVRGYGLHGAAAALLILAILFLWKNAFPFIPPHLDVQPGSNLVMGREAEEGFVSLLRRCIPRRELLRACSAEWKKAFDHDGRNVKAGHVDRVLMSEEARPQDERHLVQSYQTIVEGLRRK